MLPVPRRNNTESRAKRILGKMSCFISASSEEASRPPYSHEKMSGKFLGVYRNPSPSPEDVLVTSKGIAVRTDTQFRFFSYATIPNPHIVSDGRTLLDDGSTKHLADGISITTEDNRQVTIPVR